MVERAFRYSRREHRVIFRLRGAVWESVGGSASLGPCPPCLALFSLTRWCLSRAAGHHGSVSQWRSEADNSGALGVPWTAAVAWRQRRACAAASSVVACSQDTAVSSPISSMAVHAS